MASKVVLVVLCVLDLIAFAFAIAADQQMRSSVGRVEKDGDTKYCVYGSDRAADLGDWAITFLLASQVLVMTVTRCLCCGRKLLAGGSRTCAIICFITCWVTFIIAEVCLLAGWKENAYRTYRTYLSDNDSCESEKLKIGVFGAGAAFIVFNGIVSKLYYVYYSKTDVSYLPRGSDAGNGIMMGTL